MAKSKRKPGEAGSSGVAQVLALWGAGDLRGARAAARAQLAAGAPEADRPQLERVIRDTLPDPRALQVSVFCLAVVAAVLLLTKFFG